MMRRMRTIALTMGFVVLTGCISPPGDTAAEQRRAIQQADQEILARLYEKEPAARSVVESAAGHGTFTNAEAQVLLLGGGSGYGMVTDQRDGSVTYMEMKLHQAGPGVGGQSFSTVLVFQDADAMQRFMLGEWEMGGETVATAASGASGGSAVTNASYTDGITHYRFGGDGLLIKAALRGAKYVPIERLNQAATE